MNRWSTEDFYGSENTLYDTVMTENVIIHVYEYTEYATSVVNPNANYRLQVIMMCQCRFTNCHKCPTLVGDAGNGGGCVRVGAASIWEISIPSTQFCSGAKNKNAQLRTSNV